jgi:N-acetylneuraminic acid mutarotase
MLSTSWRRWLKRNDGTPATTRKHHAARHIYRPRLELFEDRTLPAPLITGLDTPSRPEASAAFTLTVNGSGFDQTSVLQWNGTALSTTVVSSSQLSAMVPATDLVEEGSAAVTVANPGGSSNVQNFFISDPAPVVVVRSGLAATEGTSFSGAVATFTDPGGAEAVGTYRAVIDWGDGSSSLGTISGGGGGAPFSVSGNHTYAQERSVYPVTVSVTDDGGLALSAANWSSAAPMSRPRYGFGLTAGTDGRIYALGDARNYPNVNSAEVYDPASNSWTALPSMPGDFTAAATGLDGKIYAMADGPYDNSAAVYDPRTNLWTGIASTPFSIYDAVALGGPDGRIYLIGGFEVGGYDAKSPDVFAYDPHANTWTRVAQLLQGTQHEAGAVGPDGRLYIFGGYDANGPYDASAVQVYDTHTNTWSYAAPMPGARSGMAAATGADGRIYVFGGLDSYSDTMNVVEVYDPRTNAWAELPALPTARAGLGAALGSDGRIYVIGGEPNTGTGIVEALTTPAVTGKGGGTIAVADAAPVVTVSASLSATALTPVHGVVATFTDPAWSGSVDAGLVSYYPLDGNVNDQQGVNNPSATSAVAFVAGESNQGIALPARDGYLDIHDNGSLDNAQFTWAAWVRPDGAGPNNDSSGNAIIEKDSPTLSGSANGFALRWRATDNRFLFDVMGSVVASTDAFAPGQFYNVVGTYDGAAIKLYVNGTLEGQLALATTVQYDSSEPWTIGATGPTYRGNGFPRTWNGVIDDVAIYNRALSASEVQRVYAAAGGTPGSPDPVGNYKATIDWDDGTTADAADTVAFSNGVFTVSGSHTYSQPGSYTLNITVQDDGTTASPGATGSRQQIHRRGQFLAGLLPGECSAGRHRRQGLQRDRHGCRFRGARGGRLRRHRPLHQQRPPGGAAC